MCNDNSPIPHVSLFSGYDGLGIALKRIFGGHLRTIAYCEREAYPCANLVEKIESKQLDAAPIFTDVHEFPWEQYYPFMANGIMSFGFPCQPVSVAGKRKVVDDERWLFDVCADGIEIMRPGWIFAENVEGLLSAKMPNGKPVIAHIHERLEKMGYIVKTGLFSAAEVGAPHQRKRVFILAHAGLLGQTESKQQAAGVNMVNAHCERPQRSGYSRQTWETVPPSADHQWPARPGEPQYEWEEPRSIDRKGVKSELGGTFNGASGGVDPNKNRVDRLRLLGNGVVPQTAEKAFITLYEALCN